MLIEIPTIPNIIKKIETNSPIDIYLDTFKILEGVDSNFNFSEYINKIYKKYMNEDPSQIYLHPDEYKKVRCTPNEIALLINQNLIGTDINNNDERLIGLINNGNLSYSFCYSDNECNECKFLD